MDELLADLHCALLPRGAALPRWIRAISQDRDRGRCDHDPILVEMVEKYMCRVKKKPTLKKRKKRVKASAREREETNVKSFFKRDAQCVSRIRAYHSRVASSPASL